MKKILNNQKGQTLIILLSYMVIAIIVITASVALVFNSSKATDKVYQGANSLDIAESGAETAMIKLLRNPAYTGETLQTDGGKAVITVTGSNPKIILSTGTYSNFTRIIQVTVSSNNGTLTTTSWKEI